MFGGSKALLKFDKVLKQIQAIGEAVDSRDIVLADQLRDEFERQADNDNRSPIEWTKKSQ